jgi:hypothetical protein
MAPFITLKISPSQLKASTLQTVNTTSKYDYSGSRELRKRELNRERVLERWLRCHDLIQPDKPRMLAIRSAEKDHLPLYLLMLICNKWRGNHPELNLCEMRHEPGRPYESVLDMLPKEVPIKCEWLESAFSESIWLSLEYRELLQKALQIPVKTSMRDIPLNPRTDEPEEDKSRRHRGHRPRRLRVPSWQAPDN